MQWRVAPFVDRVHGRPVLDEKVGHIHVTVRAGVVQWNQPTLVLGVYIRPRLKEEFDHLQSIEDVQKQLS